MKSISTVSCAIAAFLAIAPALEAAPTPSGHDHPIAALACGAGADTAPDTFASRWEAPPEADFEFTPFDFQVYGGWGRIRGALGQTGEPRQDELVTEQWNPFKNQDAYTYGAYVLYHESMFFILPGLRMEFNNISENLILCVDVAGPASFFMWKKGVRIGSSIAADDGSEVCFGFHGLFSAHFYVLGEIQGPYIGPVFGFNAFYKRGEGLFAFPIVGADAGLRLNAGPFTICMGAMAYGMSLKHVHPDYGFEFYAGIGFLI